jgi:hypothetical protein
MKQFVKMKKSRDEKVYDENVTAPALAQSGDLAARRLLAIDTRQVSPLVKSQEPTGLEDSFPMSKSEVISRSLHYPFSHDTHVPHLLFNPFKLSLTRFSRGVHAPRQRCKC